MRVQETFNTVVMYFGESPKTTPPSVFFPVFVRFVKAYKVSVTLVLSQYHSTYILMEHNINIVVNLIFVI